MWPAIISGVSTLFTGWIDVKKAKQQAEAAKASRIIQGEFDYDIMAMEAAKTSWKDEMIMIIWYSPMVMGWYDNTTGTIVSAEQWVQFVGKLPYWWQFGAFGIMSASFGLRWYFKQQGFKVGATSPTGTGTNK
jgi:hypothetical protein